MQDVLLLENMQQIKEIKLTEEQKTAVNSPDGEFVVKTVQGFIPGKTEE